MSVIRHWKKSVYRDLELRAENPVPSPVNFFIMFVSFALLILEIKDKFCDYLIVVNNGSKNTRKEPFLTILFLLGTFQSRIKISLFWLIRKNTIVERQRCFEGNSLTTFFLVIHVSKAVNNKCEILKKRPWFRLAIDLSRKLFWLERWDYRKERERALI